jgi:uncharacterized protein (TIGR02145 family)
MKKKSFYLRNVVAIAICLAGFCANNIFAQTTDSKETVKIGGTSWAISNAGAERPEEHGKLMTQERAKKNCPDGWRLPTDKEMKDLIASGYVWGTLNDVAGGYFGNDAANCAKNKVLSGNCIFLPAAGTWYPYFKEFLGVGEEASYWSNDVHEYGLLEGQGDMIRFREDYEQPSGGTMHTGNQLGIRYVLNN